MNEIEALVEGIERIVSGEFSMTNPEAWREGGWGFMEIGEGVIRVYSDASHKQVVDEYPYNNEGVSSFLRKWSVHPDVAANLRTFRLQRTAGVGIPVKKAPEVITTPPVTNTGSAQIPVVSLNKTYLDAFANAVRLAAGLQRRVYPHFAVVTTDIQNANTSFEWFGSNLTTKNTSIDNINAVIVGIEFGIHLQDWAGVIAVKKSAGNLPVIGDAQSNGEPDPTAPIIQIHQDLYNLIGNVRASVNKIVRTGSELYQISNFDIEAINYETEVVELMREGTAVDDYKVNLLLKYSFAHPITKYTSVLDLAGIEGLKSEFVINVGSKFDVRYEPLYNYGPISENLKGKLQLTLFMLMVG